MGRTFGWPRAAAALAAAALLAGCKEVTTAAGGCPTLCPTQEVVVLDTVLTGIVTSDSSYRGYVVPAEAAINKVSNVPGALAVTVVKFNPRHDYWFGTSLLDTIRIARIDSVTLAVRVVQRDTTVDSLRLLVYRAPRPLAIDTLTTYDSVVTWVHDSLLVDSIPIPDSLVSGVLTRRLPDSAFQPDAADSDIVGAILVLRSAAPTITNVTASGFSDQPIIRWYARAADTLKTNQFSSTPLFDTFVQSPEPPAMLADRRFVGNLPSARTLLRLNIPRYFIDSTTVVRARLVLSPVGPIGGAPSQSFVMEAHGIIRDFGPKSFFTPDAALSGSVTLTVGDTAQVELGLTRILQTWHGLSPDSLPRTIILRLADEGRTLGELAFAPAAAGARAPFLRLTYIKPYAFGVP